MRRTALATAIALLFASPFAEAQLTLEPVGRFQGATAGFDQGAAEIVAYDAGTRRIFVVNAQEATVDVLSATDPAFPVKVGQISVRQLPGFDPARLGAANSVAARNGLIAVAIEAAPATDRGVIAFYDAATLQLLKTIEAGALPDAVAFSNTGHFVIAANEGEPRFANGVVVDPEGSVTIIDVRTRRGQRDFRSCTADFRAFDTRRAELLAAGVIIDPLAASVSQDLEPEYGVAMGNNAYVTLQENNAIAVVQLNQCRVSRIMPLGFKDHGLAKNSLDTSDREVSGSKGNIQLRSWQNLYGLYQPDGIAAFEAADGETYLVVANEGDVREIEGADALRPSYGARVSSSAITLDPTAFEPSVKDAKNLGRLNVNASLGAKTVDGKPVYEKLYAYGGRSFSIFTTDGRLVYDSANEFESIIADKVAKGELAMWAFNANHNNNSGGDDPGASNNTFDSRSDDKGPEPEGVVVGQVGNRTYAFIGLERIGGVMIYDVTNPAQAFYVDYVNGKAVRDFDEPVCTSVNANGTCANGVPNARAGDLGPEGLAFVPAVDSPNGRPLLIVGNEVSGSTRIYEVVAKP
jgi:2',3'-cyclic-nucleotide 2'-phosphodiesterase / 3'-nucleotidase / 5'-nucleotidase